MIRVRVCATILLLAGCVVLSSVALASPQAPSVVKVSEPRVLTQFQVAPTYPPAAKMARFTGSVTLAAEVNVDGTVGAVEVIESDHPNLGFEAASESAVKQWKFRPASVDGVPVDAVTYVRLHFQTYRGKRDSGYVAGGPIANSVSGFGAAGMIGGVGKGIGSSTNVPASHDEAHRIRTVKLPPAQGGLYDRSKLIPTDNFVDLPAPVAAIHR